MYSYEDAFKACTDWFNGDELRASVVVNKYLLRDRDGVYLEKDPQDIADRLTAEFCRVENKYPQPVPEKLVRNAVSNFGPIIPHGSPMFGIGNWLQTSTLGNCYVVNPPTDSYGGILATDASLAQIAKRRGGVGVDISTLRPAGTPVHNSALTSDGILSFMKRFANTIQEVGQNGRRGACLESCDCRHPDILDFIRAKTEKGLTGVNISVKWTDDFLEAVEAGRAYTLRYPVDSPPEAAEITKEVDAAEIWNEACKAAWTKGDPGCLFWDTVTRKSISDCYIRTAGTNPCGEQPLGGGQSCLLLSINLTSMVTEPFTEKAGFDFREFTRSCRTAARLADDMVDLETEKLEAVLNKIDEDPEPDEIKEPERRLWEDILNKHIKYRKVGIGFTGLADVLAMLGCPYSSDSGTLRFLEKMMSTFHNGIYRESSLLAAERGPFPGWDWEKEKDCHYIRTLEKDVQESIEKHGRRNLSSLTVAPAGTVSIAAGVSSGMEPVFSCRYTRRRRMMTSEENDGQKPDFTDDDGFKWVYYTVNHPGYSQWKRITGKDGAENSPYAGSEAHDLDPLDRIVIQSEIQDRIDSGIASTVNLKESAGVDDISNIWLRSWREGLKGVTVFRDGCMEGIMSRGCRDGSICRTTAPGRPRVLECDIHYSNIKSPSTGEVDNWIFLIGKLDGDVYEVFGGARKDLEIPVKFQQGWLKKTKSRSYDLILGSLNSEDHDHRTIENINGIVETEPGSYTRIISMSLRHGVPLPVITDQLLKDSESDMFTFEKGMARVLKKYIRDGEKSGSRCPSCGEKSLIFAEGCVRCVCGWSGCS